MKICRPFRRKLVQLASLAATNPHLANFSAGRLYKGDWKAICAPGLNCYSCPAATMSCPIGALQAVASSAGFRFSFYAAGFLLAAGVLMGRAVCAFLCPFGLFQELLHKIPLPDRKLWPPLLYGKYFALAIFVLFLPMAWRDDSGTGIPAFCQYICPAGTLEGGLALLATHPELQKALGFLFAWKLAILALVVIGSMVHYRFFCRTLCPLGAVYGLLNRISVYRIHREKSRCTVCGRCRNACPMGVDPVLQPDSAECIRCGECETACPHGAISLR